MKDIYTGTYKVKLDAKHRISIPSKIRDCAQRRNQDNTMWYYTKHRDSLYTITDSPLLCKDNPQDWFASKQDAHHRITLHDAAYANETFLLKAMGDYLVLEKENQEKTAK
ncbi:MAG: MraZ N-terminal domain-containing protein [Candidatus Woesearchaeota archaeon]